MMATIPPSSGPDRVTLSSPAPDASLRLRSAQATQRDTAGRNEGLNMYQMLGLVTEIGTMIAIPAVIFGFGGAYLDKNFGTSPLFVIVGLALAIISSCLAVWHRIQPLLDSFSSSEALAGAESRSIEEEPLLDSPALADSLEENVKPQPQP